MKIDFIMKDVYLNVVCSGDFDKNEMTGCCEKAAREYCGSDKNGMLLDFCALKGYIGVHDGYQLVRSLLGFRNSGKKIAILRTGNPDEGSKFCVLAGGNRGLIIEEFDDRSKAEAWIEKGGLYNRRISNLRTADKHRKMGGDWR
jgi:hypothetical protein